MEKAKTKPLELHNLLYDIFAREESATQKIDRLKKSYGLTMEQDLERRINTMCNLSESVFEEGRKEGREEGRKEGADRIAKLMTRLLSDGKIDEAKRAAADAGFREELLLAYSL